MWSLKLIDLMKRICLLLLLCSNAALAQNNNVCNWFFGGKKKKSSIVGTWELSFLEAAPSVDALYPKQKPYLTINKKQNLMSGFNGCNTFSVPIKIEGYQIAYLKPIAVTQKYCEGVDEEKFMSALERTQTFTFIEQGKLDFISGDLGVAQFTKK